jgi:Xaa-Pro aminopeptidase
MTAPAELPFPTAEYRDRARRVREEMRRRGLDVLYVLSPPNLHWLTGFESIWYPPRAPVGCVLSVDSENLVFTDYERHRNHASTAAHFDDAIWFTYADCVEAVAQGLAARGLTGGNVGMERWTVAPGAPLVAAIADAIRGTGADVVDGDWVVDRVRALKTEAELHSVRRAAAIVDTAFREIQGYMRPGRTELQIAARLNAIMADEGGEEPAIRTMVSSGPLVWCRTHGAPGHRPLERGDVVYVDACGVHRRYHVDLCRTFAIGDDCPGARDVLDWTAQSVGKVQAAVRRGDPLDVAIRAAEEHVHARYGPEQIWWIGGYALGVALPPNWVGHTYLDNAAFEQLTWEPGYVTNYENILFSREQAFTASYMETLLMTETGIEVLSEVPRTLTLVEI